MVEKITLFEPHFDGTQFGPTVGDDAGERSPTGNAETTVAAESDETARPSGSRAGRFLVAVGAIAVLAAMGRFAVRRFRVADDDGEDVAFEDVDVDAPEEPRAQ